ncbi:MAG: SapC family protein [Alphaproteobacteria bacterium]|nr:SapC family protein [Alphaproteobacteria bacterium]MDE2163397.1 SapC family protein [Alphaproteobacteria bacterium]MDE2266129.1 SapC family protein [Alphaproteobacteria bacterium]
MTNIVALNNQIHRSLHVQAAASAHYGDNQRFVAVVVKEFPLLVVHYPIFFSKDAETGAFYCGAMLGFDEGENLFLEEGKPYLAYRPLNLQRGPFFTAGSDLVIDLDNPRVNTANGQALFTESGEATPYLQSIIALFRELRPGIEQTKAFIETLMKLKLVEPIDIKVSFDDGTSRQVEGLYGINSGALRDLPDAMVLDLFRRGYLHFMSLMLASLKQVPVLAQKKNNRLLQGGGMLSGRLD